MTPLENINHSTTMKQLIATLALIAAGSLLFAADKKHEEMGHSPMAAMIADKSGPEFEAAFLAMMIHHHKGGAPMWNLAAQKSKNETILSLQKKTVPKEEKEIEQMRSWLKEWHNKTPEDFKEPEESKKMMEKDMAELQAASGKEFDALFAKKMAHHHMGAIEMADMAAQKAAHAEVKQLAQEISKAQSSDKERLRNVAEHANH